MRHMIPLVVVFALCGLLAACGTPEYQQTRQVCFQEWAAKIPPAYQQVLVNKERAVEVPDGTSSCTKTGNTTNCKQGMRREWIPYTAVETVDANEPERNRRILQCTQSQCIQDYGNPDCKT